MRLNLWAMSNVVCDYKIIDDKPKCAEGVAEI